MTWGGARARPSVRYGPRSRRVGHRRVRLWVVIVAAFLAAACGKTDAPPPEASEPVPAVEMGVAIPASVALWSEPAAVERDLDAAVWLGARWVRTDVPWVQLSWQPGQTDFSRVDRFVNAARRRGLRVLGVVGTIPDYLRPAGTTYRDGPTTDAQIQAFAAFAGQAAQRYRGRIEAWEVWNEPNVRQSWGPRPSLPLYGRLLAQTTRAVAQAAPESVILSGGPGGATAPGVDVAPTDWIEGLSRGGFLTGVEAIAVHPYSDLRRGDGGEMGTLTRLRRTLSSQGAPGLALWATEVGAPTAGSASVSGQEAARLLTESLSAWRALGDPGPFFYYTLRDSGGPSREGHFGLLDAAGRPKPVASAFRAAARR